MADDDLAAVLPAFCRELREHTDIPASPAQLVTLQRALAALPHLDLDELYWAGRSTLGVGPADRPGYDRVFADFFIGGAAAEADAMPPPDGDPGFGAGRADQRAAMPIPLAGDQEREAAGEEPEPVGGEASAVEVLRVTPFAACTPEEQAALRALIRRMRVRPPTRPVRRLRPAARAGRLDLRRTVRASLRHHGEVFPRWRDRRDEPRRIVMMLDVSRSMAPYSRLLLHFAHAVSLSGLRVEVVCFGTRVTRVTRLLRKHRSARGLEAAAATVLDWDGGTRIGESLRVAQTMASVRGALRGSVVVVLSDGLEQDDPAQLDAALRRMRRTCHALVWANPLAGDPRYEPLTAGMVAALPHIDVLCAGDSLAALERLAATLSELQDVDRWPGRRAAA